MLYAVLEIGRALCEHALRRALDVRSEDALTVRLVELARASVVNTAGRYMTTFTYDDERPLVRGVEGDLEHLGMLLLMLVEVPQVSACEPYEASLRSITEDCTLVEWNVRPVKLDARVERGDVDGLAHAWCIDREGRRVRTVVVRLGWM